MAAQRAGIKQVFIPEENRDDLEDVAQEVKSARQIFPVKQVSDVLEKLDLHPATPEKKGKKSSAPARRLPEPERRPSSIRSMPWKPAARAASASRSPAAWQASSPAIPLRTASSR